MANTTDYLKLLFKTCCLSFSCCPLSPSCTFSFSNFRPFAGTTNPIVAASKPGQDKAANTHALAPLSWHIPLPWHSLIEVVYPLHYQVLPFSWNWTRKQVVCVCVCVFTSLTFFAFILFILQRYIYHIYYRYIGWFAAPVCTWVCGILFVFLPHFLFEKKKQKDETHLHSSFTLLYRVHIYIYVCVCICVCATHLFINIKSQWTMAMPCQIIPQSASSMMLHFARHFESSAKNFRFFRLFL